jgi:hypothetical protein
LPDSRLGIRTAPLLLLSRSDVRADVRLDAEQTADAERTLEKLYLQAEALKGKSGREALTGRRAIDQEMEHWLRNRLSEPQQKRLLEIDLQWEGPSALISRPVLGDHLRLTPEQRTRLGEAVAECNRRRQEGTHWLECERTLFQQTRDLLTPEQLRSWKAMLGPPFQRQVAATPETTKR